MQIAALCPQIFDEEHYHCSRIAAKNHIQVWFFMLKLQSNLSVNPAFLNCLTNNITLHISTNQETAALEEASSCRMQSDPQLLVKGCISSPVLDDRDSSRIHILLLSDSKTILNKMQVYLFSFLFVLSFYHALFCHYSLRLQPLFIKSLQFFQDLSNIFIHADRLSPYFFRCICFTLIQAHIKCLLKCICHLPKRIFYNTRSIISYT